MKISKVITKLVERLSVEGDVEVVNIDCDGSISYSKAAKTEYVDLGLPSGTLWSKCNYGATTETESGRYYTWDEAQELPIILPTKEQCKELVENTTSVWVENYGNSGVNGRLFISNKNGNYIFIPAAGYCGNSSVDNVGSNGYVWSSSLNSSYPNNAFGLYFNSSLVLPQYRSSRYYGCSVRGVLNQ